MASLPSDAAFSIIEDRLKSKPDLKNSINATYLFNITVNGKNAAYWSMTSHFYSL